MAGKYDPLGKYLQNRKSDWLASFSDIEDIIKNSLPNSARKYPAWWSNDRTSKGRHSRVWLEIGWETQSLNIPSEKVKFVRKT